MLGARYIEALNAHAALLAGIIDIYRLQPRGAMTLLSKEELSGATFIDGGNVLRTVTGVLHHPSRCAGPKRSRRSPSSPTRKPRPVSAVRT